ncbi:MAG: spore germination protein [Clostridiaceae bacterium]
MANVNSNDLKNKLNSYSLTKSLEKNIELFKTQIFNDDSTVIYRNFSNKISHIDFCLIFVDGLVSNEIINKNILKPMINNIINNKKTNTDICDYLSTNIININEIIKSNDFKKIIESVYYGDTLLLIESCNYLLILNTKGWPGRNISEPVSETTVKGPREGFTESIIVNLSLIRKKLTTNDLKIKYKSFGARTNTKTCLIYMNGVANPNIINEIENRLDTIDVDGLHLTGHIEELITDNPLCPFKTIGSTERPDIIVSKLLEGNIVLLCDGTPFAIYMPFLFQEYFQTNEDYYNHFLYSSMNRLIRILSLFITTSAPSIYVAILTFHQEMIPTKLILSIYQSRVGVPFPTSVECFAMLLVFEIIREGAERLPKHISQTLGIVGALVIGEAVVTAKFVSAPVVIIAAISGITAFLIPTMASALVPIKFLLLLLSSILGLYGYFFGVIGIFIQLFSMKSFGINYMDNLSSFKFQDIKDTFIRAPWWLMKNRPKDVSIDSIRSNNSKKKKD